MKESLLIKLCFIFCIIGIITLIVVNKFTSPNRVKVSELEEGMNFASVLGEINSKYVSRKGTVFLNLKDDTGEIKVVVFKGSVDVSDINKGDSVEIMGEVQQYKGELEIIAKKIKLL